MKPKCDTIKQKLCPQRDKYFLRSIRFTTTQTKIKRVNKKPKKRNITTKVEITKRKCDKAKQWNENVKQQNENANRRSENICSNKTKMQHKITKIL